jgi:hypothetical protein
MEQTLQAQYNLIKEGKGNKAYFLKSAFRLFPDMLSPVNTFEDTTRILKNRGIISEGIGGLVTSGKKQDWHAIFNENMGKLKENSEEEKIQKLKDIMAKVEKGDTQATQTLAMLMADMPGLKEGDDEDEFLTAAIEDFEEKDTADANISPINYRNLREAKEKEPSKEVLDNQKHNFDYKDEKNYDNLFGQEFLDGYYTEMKDSANEGKNVEELRAIVAKNLAKDKQYYLKNGQFGVKGLGYTTEAPGLGEPKEPKGKFKSSGYGDIPKSSNLQESVLRSQIHLLIKEVLTELQQEPVAHADEEEFEDRVIAKLKSELRTKNKHHQTKAGEPDMDLESYYDDAMKFVSQNIKSIAKKFLNHSKPEGGVSDAVKYALSNVSSNPIHEKKKPSAGLTKKEKSAVSKKAHAGKDIGKKGKGFEKVAKAAEKEYGSEEAGKKVAAATMWKNLAKKK